MKERFYADIVRRTIQNKDCVPARPPGAEQKPRKSEINYDPSRAELLREISIFKGQLRSVDETIRRRKERLKTGRCADDPEKEKEWRIKEEGLLQEDEALAQSWRDKIEEANRKLN